MSCGKYVLGSYFFLYHKSITIKVSWTGQYLACTPETVEGSLFIETVLPLHRRSAMQHIATVSMPGRKPNHGLTMVSSLNEITMEQTSVSDTFVSMLAHYANFFSWAHRGSTLEILFSSNSL